MTESLTYTPVGATKDEVLPAGFGHLRERRRLGDATLLDPAGDFVLSFGLQRGAGILVSASEPLARSGVELTQRVRLGPLRLSAPTRVVYVLSEANRRGFAYGSLPGHPESGEELFLVERVGGATYAEVRAYSRPGRWFTKLGGPVVRLVQRWYVRRYLDALERAVGQPPGQPPGQPLSPPLRPGERGS
jgi:uncharacterized protein (UPF0548 family)